MPIISLHILYAYNFIITALIVIFLLCEHSVCVCVCCHVQRSEKIWAKQGHTIINYNIQGKETHDISFR